VSEYQAALAFRDQRAEEASAHSGRGV